MLTMLITKIIVSVLCEMNYEEKHCLLSIYYVIFILISYSQYTCDMLKLLKERLSCQMQKI